MKISPFDPKSIFQGAVSVGTRESRLGFHAQAARLEDLRSSEHGIVIFGIADDTGIRNVGGRIGAKDGPREARQRLYKFTTGVPRVPVYDLGDLYPASSIESTHEQATDIVRLLLDSGHFPLVIGGGHDLGFPHALGALEHSRKKTRFLNIDAHLDVRPTTNGITSGSPWYLLSEHPLFAKTKSRIEEFGIQPHCNAHSLVDYAAKHKFGLHWLADIRKKKGSADSQFAKLMGGKGGKDRLLVSLDIDSVRFSEAPGCSAPQILGFTAAEAIRMSFLSGAHPRVDSFGIFELSPPLDPDGRTCLLVAHCINACLEGFATRLKVKKK
ncbi:MAG TPA: formimidoylglutamase [Bdellovibrionota bacterium]|jgi:arginase family enzyme